jgi:hypothetical protein
MTARLAREPRHGNTAAQAFKAAQADVDAFYVALTTADYLMKRIRETYGIDRATLGALVAKKVREHAAQ